MKLRIGLIFWPKTQKERISLQEASFIYKNGEMKLVAKKENQLFWVLREKI